MDGSCKRVYQTDFFGDPKGPLFKQAKLILTSLRIDSTAGNVNLKDMTAKNMYLSSTSGMLDLYRLQAEDIRFMTTSGKVSCDALNGSVICTTTSGDVSIKNAVGSGEYKFRAFGN